MPLSVPTPLIIVDDIEVGNTDTVIWTGQYTEAVRIEILNRDYDELFVQNWVWNTQFARVDPGSTKVVKTPASPDQFIASSVSVTDPFNPGEIHAIATGAPVKLRLIRGA